MFKFEEEVEVLVYGCSDELVKENFECKLVKIIEFRIYLLEFEEELEVMVFLEV